MLFDLVSYSGWLIAALSVGLVVGWRTYLDVPRRNWRDGWIVWGALAFVIGVIIAALKLLAGRYGLWLEVALLMIAFYIVGCILGGWLKRLVGAHESRGAATMPLAAGGRVDAKLEAEQQASAKAAADRLAVEVAAKAEADRKEADRKEVDRKAAAKAEADRLAAEAFPKAEADRKAAVAKAEADRLAAEAAQKAEAERARAEIEQRAAAAAKAEAGRLAAAALAKAEAERLTAAAVAKALEDRRAKAEADRLPVAAAATVETSRGSANAEPAPATLTRRRRPSKRELRPTAHRPIVLWRKPPQRPRLNDKQTKPSKPRRVVWLQRVSQRSRLGETAPSRPTRPMRRRTLWLRRLPRPRPIAELTLRYLRRRTEQTYTEQT